MNAKPEPFLQKIFCSLLMVGAVALVALIIYGSYGAMVKTRDAQAAKAVGKMALSQQRNLSETRNYVKFTAIFTKTPRVNTAEVSYQGWDGVTFTTERDYNKTKIASEWVGQKSKGAVKGFFKGLLRKTLKHE
jgi:Tfp pilus assembly protein PilE